MGIASQAAITVSIEVKREAKKHPSSHPTPPNQGIPQASVSSQLIVATAHIDGIARPTISRLVDDSSG